MIWYDIWYDAMWYSIVRSPCWQVAATAHSVISTHVHGLGCPDRNLAVLSDAKRKLVASSASAITKHTNHSEPVKVRMNTSWVMGKPAALYANMRLDESGQ